MITGIITDLITFYMVITAISIAVGFNATWSAKKWGQLIIKLVSPVTGLIKSVAPFLVVKTFDLSPFVLLVLLFGLQKLLPYISALV